MRESTVESPQTPVQTEPDDSKPVVPSRLCLLTFGGERLAVDLSHVSEVFKVDSITAVPGMPPALIGVANLRGAIVPVVDLHPSLGLPSVAAPHYAIVIRRGAQHVGVLIDEVPEMHTTEFGDVLEMLPGEVTRQRPFLSGVLTMEGRPIGMVDVARLLALVEGRIDRHAA
jgi:purine-binding chemotaxis protein CheW